MADNFIQRKKNVLMKTDKSHKSEWDERIASLCIKINSLENYYTTSSCSGRVILMINQDKKEEDLFIVVFHDEVSLDELKEGLKKAVVKNKNIKFKLEPCIIHIACKTLKDAHKIYDKGKLAGWKRSGIIGIANGFTVELNSTEKLEFPIVSNKKILVADNFLKIVVKEANEKLKKGWKKIEKLEKLII